MNSSSFQKCFWASLWFTLHVPRLDILPSRQPGPSRHSRKRGPRRRAWGSTVLVFLPYKRHFRDASVAPAPRQFFGVRGSSGGKVEFCLAHKLHAAWRGSTRKRETRRKRTVDQREYADVVNVLYCPYFRLVAGYKAERRVRNAKWLFRFSKSKR